MDWFGLYGFTEVLILRFCEGGRRKMLNSSWLRQAPKFHGKKYKKIKATPDL
jgi:hypothetical protein